jgi:hypothetical protein
MPSGFRIDEATFEHDRKCLATHLLQHPEFFQTLSNTQRLNFLRPLRDSNHRRKRFANSLIGTPKKLAKTDAEWRKVFLQPLL